VTVFISYARRDEPVARALRDDIERARRDVWFDRELEGGQAWWDTILGQIRSCELFVFLLSPDSVRSKACRAELGYAVALGRPLLPVMARDVNIDLAPDPIGVTQFVDYRQRTPESMAALLMAVTQAPAASPPLPDPLPAPPPTPVADLGPVREQLGRPSLTHTEQVDLLNDLKAHAESEDEREAAVALLGELSRRSDVSASVVQEIDVLVSRMPASDRGVQDWSSYQPEPVAGTEAARRAQSAALMSTLLSLDRAGKLTPILGLGLTDSLVGARHQIAREWAQTFKFPMARHERDDMPHVAQFVRAMTDEWTLRARLGEYISEELERRYADVVGGAPKAALGDRLKLAWEHRLAESSADIHRTLAGLSCPIYVTAHPANLLAEALHRAGKEPVVELCRWRPDVYDWPVSTVESDPGYVPSPERPLVFHVFGNLDFPDSLVLTEDDYFDFLIAVTENKDELVPTSVRSRLADSALLFLGFGLQDWDVRVLLRTLVSQDKRMKRYKHTAAQIDLGSDVESPSRAREYLETYFRVLREPPIDIYWGSVEEFADDLAAALEPAR
jgi:hypothetical protein